MSPASTPPPALVELCRAHQDRLVGLLTLHTGSREAAEDLAQDTIERACAHWEQLASHPAPDRWLFRVALNLATSRWRRLGRWTRIEGRLRREEAAEVAALASTRPPGEDPALAVHLRRELAALPVRERDVLLCRYYLDLSVADTADVVGCPPNTVKSLTRTGLERLRASDRLAREVDDDR